MKRQILVTTIATVVGITAVAAESYPTRPITFVVPFAAGGPTDVLARTLAEPMSAALGGTIVVENVSGAGGSIGVGRVAHAPADGYTVSVGNWSTHVVNGVTYTLQYDLLKDFDPVAMLPSSPQLIVARKTMPAASLNELIEWMRANRATVGTAGVGSASHISGLFFESTAKVKFSFVPYRGAGPAMQDVVAGNIDLMFDQASNSLPQVQSGTIKAYAVTKVARLPSAPEIPTVDEAGLPKFYISVWHGLWVPRGTPGEVIAKLNAAVNHALADHALRRRFGELGQDLPPNDQQTPAALAALQKLEIDKWWPLIKAAQVKDN